MLKFGCVPYHSVSRHQNIHALPDAGADVDARSTFIKPESKREILNINILKAVIKAQLSSSTASSVYTDNNRHALVINSATPAVAVKPDRCMSGKLCSNGCMRKLDCDITL